MVLESRDDAPASHSDSDRNTPATRSAIRDLSFGLDRASQAGTTLLTAVLVCTGLGWLLDRWLGTEPWLLAIGALLGNAVGIYLLYLSAQEMNDDPKQNHDPAAGRNGSDAGVPEDHVDRHAAVRDTPAPPVIKGPTQ